MIQEAINHYEYGVSHDIFSEPVTTYAKLSVAALKKQMPMKPAHIYEEHSEHLWKCDQNDEIDLWAFEEGYCNGPICTRCWHSECVHCNPEWEIDPVRLCIVDKDICPVCCSELEHSHNYCPKCGQALDWGENDD